MRERTSPSPQNGTHTHPLSKHALGVLRMLERAPLPSMQINAGVVNRFHREGLTDTVQLPSPFKSHKGASINHERITGAGLAALAGKKGTAP